MGVANPLTNLDGCSSIPPKKIALSQSHHQQQDFFAGLLYHRLAFLLRRTTCFFGVLQSYYLLLLGDWRDWPCSFSLVVSWDLRLVRVLEHLWGALTAMRLLATSSYLSASVAALWKQKISPSLLQSFQNFKSTENFGFVFLKISYPHLRWNSIWSTFDLFVKERWKKKHRHGKKPGDVQSQAWEQVPHCRWFLVFLRPKRGMSST